MIEKMNSSTSRGFSVFTVCNLAYLPKALVLAESLLRFENMKLKIYLFDKKLEVELPVSLADFFWIEDLGRLDIRHLAFKYDITEFSTCLKPFIALSLLEFEERVIFLDPDTCLFDSLASILSDLEEHPIVLTPHYTRPQPESWPDTDIGMMRFGSFNLGFFAIAKCDQGLQFLRWWSDRCIRFGYFETQFGLSTDQKWVSIAPCFFPDLHVSFNMGYNVAFWNLQERVLEKVGDGQYRVNGKFPLIFFHFSSFDESNPARLTKRPLPEEHRNREDLREIISFYNSALKSYAIQASKVKYGFDYMSNGDYISPTLRRAYACVAADLPADTDPFDAQGVVGKFVRRNHLKVKASASYQPNGFDDIGNHKLAFKTIYFLMRLVLLLLGPNRFANLSRLMVYLSSLRQNKGMWKV